MHNSKLKIYAAPEHDTDCHTDWKVYMLVNNTQVGRLKDVLTFIEGCFDASKLEDEYTFKIKPVLMTKTYFDSLKSVS